MTAEQEIDCDVTNSTTENAKDHFGGRRKSFRYSSAVLLRRVRSLIARRQPPTDDITATDTIDKVLNTEKKDSEQKVKRSSLQRFRRRKSSRLKDDTKSKGGDPCSDPSKVQDKIGVDSKEEVITGDTDKDRKPGSENQAKFGNERNWVEGDEKSGRQMDSEVSSSIGTPFRGRKQLDTSTIGTSTPSHISNSEARTPTTSTTAPLTPVERRPPGRDGGGGGGGGGGVGTNKDKEKEKLGHRRIDDEGKVTFKKIHSSTIIESIQLGIGYAVGSLASKPERDLLMQDFAMVDNLDFPKEGGTVSPAHKHDSFKFKAYSPIAFRYFRDLFGIQQGDFLLSLCNKSMIELSNPGASGSLFYLTADDEFILKTVAHVEADFLQNLLPGYYMNLHQNPRTLLPKFFGLYCYIASGKNVRVIVMNNLLPSSVKMHRKYDLKGSTYKRKASKNERQKKSPTFKDLDFMEHYPDGIWLEASTYDALTKTIQRDCRVLESFKIMDYSLLLGIHNLDQAAREGADLLDNDTQSQMQTDCDASAGGGGANIPRSRSMNRGRLAAFSTAIESIDHDVDMPPGGIPAQTHNGERLMLYVGIIDILQSYRLRKKLEHSWKALLHDGDTVSVHRPGFYSQRFQKFMCETVFRRREPTLKPQPSQKKKPAQLATVVRRLMQEKHDQSGSTQPATESTASNLTDRTSTGVTVSSSADGGSSAASTTATAGQQQSQSSTSSSSQGPLPPLPRTEPPTSATQIVRNSSSVTKTISNEAPSTTTEVLIEKKEVKGEVITTQTEVTESSEVVDGVMTSVKTVTVTKETTKM